VLEDLQHLLRLQVRQTGAPALHQPARPLAVDEIASVDVQRLIDLMFASLEGAGVGLSAPQVGVGVRLAVIHDPAELHASIPPGVLAQQERVTVARHVLVNPVLSDHSAEVVEFFEGCLSVEGYRAVVPRARSLRLHALDRHGAPFERTAVGWYARILQHEVDHLDGRLYLERMLPSTFVSAASFAQFWSRFPVSEAVKILSAPSAE
jgi:peptide deformylase